MEHQTSKNINEIIHIGKLENNLLCLIFITLNVKIIYISFFSWAIVHIFFILAKSSSRPYRRIYPYSISTDSIVFCKQRIEYFETIIN